jgi:rhamnosyltransferase
MKKNKKPKIAVLLATFNGVQWLSEQLDSILNQHDVNLKLVISDDMSTDGTVDLLERYAKLDQRILILPHTVKFGSAAKNFYRLIIDADIGDCDFVALADQDDIWLEGKLSTLSKIAIDNSYDGVSSNVVAFWQDGRTTLIDKSHNFRKLDFLFESAGPGSTYLLTPKLVEQVREMLCSDFENINQVKAHDWLIYAICRATSKKWFISPIPTVKYRQHGNNELGVNVGLKAHFLRLKRLSNGYYRQEIVKICKITKQLTSDAYTQHACDVFINRQKFNVLKQLKLISHTRRAIQDRIILGVFIFLGVI